MWSPHYSYSRLGTSWVRLLILLLVASRQRRIKLSLLSFGTDDFVSRDGIGHLVPCQPI